MAKLIPTLGRLPVVPSPCEARTPDFYISCSLTLLLPLLLLLLLLLSVAVVATVVVEMFLSQRDLRCSSYLK